jgi:ABC-2 type transport system ATP-binding protein
MNFCFHSCSFRKEKPMYEGISEPVIKTHGLAKSYGAVHALKALDIEIPRHSITGFLGANGAGKSTTIKLLLGLLKPTAGSGSIFNMNIVTNSPQIRRRVGYLSQSPRFYDRMTAREALRFTARFFFKGPSPEIEKRVNEMLELVELLDRADRAVGGFSGGERQRLGIAQAQINYPDLLILDEPAAALDPMGRHAVLNIMERLRKHTTIFYSTHILDDVQRVSDRVVILHRGELISQGPVETLLNGTDGVVYSIVTQGDAAGVQENITRQPWVSNLSISASNGLTKWHVAVKDEQLANQELLRLVLSDRQMNVLQFGREKRELEQVFMQLVQEEDNGR